MKNNKLRIIFIFIILILLLFLIGDIIFNVFVVENIDKNNVHVLEELVDINDVRCDGEYCTKKILN